MGLNLNTPQLIGQRGGLNLVVRQDSLLFRDFNMQIVQSAGPPVGQYEHGSLFLNSKDRKIYAAIDYKITNTPDILWYKFSGDNAQDFSSGTTQNGTLAGIPAFVPGQYGNAITLDAVNDKVTIGNAMPLTFSTDWTISFWVKIQGTPWNDDDEVYIISRYKDADEYWELYLTKLGANANIQVRLRFANGGGETDEQLTTRFNHVDGWVYVHIAHDNGANDIKTRTTSQAGVENEAASLPAIAFTTEDYEIGYSNTATSFGDQAVLLDSLKIFDEDRDPSTVGTFYNIDKSNIDKVQWASYPGTFVEAA